MDLNQFFLESGRTLMLEWVQGRIQDIILNHITRDWLFYDDD
jgi:hypothetical protein